MSWAVSSHCGTCAPIVEHFRRSVLSIVHAGARPTGVVQPTVFGIIAQQQGANVPPASLRVGPSDDHELLAIEALRLDPDPAVTRCVWSVGSLGE
jgi:hypothetical protein